MDKKFHMQLDLENDAFAGNNTNEIQRLLECVVGYIDYGMRGGSLRDINGNKVGHWALEGFEEEEDGEDDDE
jgi:hypothetical protein